MPDDRGLCELPDVSELLLTTSPGPGGFPTTHSRSKIRRDRDDSDILLLWFAMLARSAARL